MNFEKIAALFLVPFLLLEFGCYAGNPAASNATNTSNASNAATGSNESGAATPSLPVSAPVASSSVIRAAGQWNDGWYQGAKGYDEAAEEYKRTNRAMVVYVSVGWCPYCRRFEKDVLSSPLVQNFLADKIKININPESGQKENAIASRYGVRGFPSFFLHPPQPGRAVQLYTGVTPGEFIEFFKEALK